jgi:gliding motility-associated-like protein
LYHVKLFVTTVDGCNSLVKERDVLVNPQPKPNFSFNDTSCLPNAIITFKNLSTIANGTENQFTYLWNLGDPGSGLSNISTAKNPVHQYIAVGPYNVKLQVTSGAHCVHDTTIVLNTIHPQPKAYFDFNKPSLCLGENVIFRDLTDSKDGIASQWNWDFDDNETSWLQNPSHTYQQIGNYNVSFYSINSFGCNSDTVSRKYRVYPLPTVNAGPDQTVLEGDGTVLQAIATGNQLQYLWSPALYLNSVTVLNPTSTPLKDVTYTLNITAEGGCKAADQVFLKILMTPKIPNTFTPNNDQGAGNNNVWTIQYLDTYPNCRVQVFTRTGQLVFESRGYKKPWDGTLNGKPLPVDTYYYIIEPESGRKPVTGYVTIIK